MPRPKPANTTTVVGSWTRRPLSCRVPRRWPSAQRSRCAARCCARAGPAHTPRASGQPRSARLTWPPETGPPEQLAGTGAGWRPSQIRSLARSQRGPPRVGGAPPPFPGQREVPACATGCLQGPPDGQRWLPQRCGGTTASIRCDWGWTRACDGAGEFSALLTRCAATQTSRRLGEIQCGTRQIRRILVPRDPRRTGPHERSMRKMS